VHMCITTWIASSLPDLFTTSRSPSHRTSINLRLPYSLLCSGHIKHFQVLGFLPFPIPTPLSMWTMSNNITAFALDLMSAYEGEHTLFWPSESG
jgi:hypothetical protein